MRLVPPKRAVYAAALSLLFACSRGSGSAPEQGGGKGPGANTRPMPVAVAQAQLRDVPVSLEGPLSVS